MRILFILFFALLIGSCQQQPPQSDSEKKDTGAEVEKTHHIKKNYYDNGALMSEVPVKDDMIHGIVKNYYKSGKLHSRVYYNLGEKTKTIWYYESGEVYRITTFSENKIDGVRKFYYRNGTLKAEVPYMKGEPIEGLKEYTTSGTLVRGYPRFQFKKIEKFDENKVILRFNLSNNTPNVEYNQIIEVDGKEIKKSLPANQGYGQLLFRLTPGYQIENKKIIIQAKTNSGRGNTYITRGVYTLNAVHHE
jgi:antitoxin component YwqK of YwqJK toxin-antitoxin module